LAGKLKTSRTDHAFAVRDNMIYIVGGYEEYKKTLTRSVEAVYISDGIGSTAKVYDNFPELSVGRRLPSCLILEKRFLYVLFGKSRKGRGEHY
jgi:hypothetical protein